MRACANARRQNGVQRTRIVFECPTILCHRNGCNGHQARWDGVSRPHTMCGLAFTITGKDEPENRLKNPIGKPPGASGAANNIFLTKEDDMQPLANILPKALDQAKANASNKPLSTAPAKSLALKDDQEGKKALANLLAQCFDIFPLYGREPEAADNIRRAFQYALADYTRVQVTEAFYYHLRHSKEFPTPADIVAIIERGGNKPPFERSVYINLVQKSKNPPIDMPREEWQYIADYEKYIVTGKN